MNLHKRHAVPSNPSSPSMDWRVLPPGGEHDSASGQNSNAMINKKASPYSRSGVGTHLKLMRHFRWSQVLSSKFPSPIFNATLFDQLVCAGLSGKGVVGIGVWGKGYGGKHGIAEGIRTDIEASWLTGELTGNHI